MVSTLPQPYDLPFEFAKGAHVGIVKPEDGFEPRLSTTWSAFVNLVTAFTISDSKVGEYVCRPMGGDGSRSDGNALPWPLLPLDLDETLPEDLPELEKWCATQGLDLVLVTTFSHAPENPRLRIWVHCSRAFDANEHKFLFRSFNQGTFFPFKLDPATAKPSQPIYLPRCPAHRKSTSFARWYQGKPLDVDALLAGYKREMQEFEKRNAKGRFAEGRGARAPGGVVDSFNHHFDLHELLLKHGYKRRTRGRYVAPGSKSGRAAVVVSDFGLISFHDPAHDVLATHNELSQPRVLDAFAVFAILEHQDNFLPAWKEASHIVRANNWEPDEKLGDAKIAGIVFKRASQAVRDLRPREMVVEGILERESLVLVTGQSNSGKTTVLQHMMLCIARGEPFGPHRAQQGKVLWIAGEDAYNAQLRFALMCQEFSLPLSTIDDIYVLAQATEILSPAYMEAFHQALSDQIDPNAQFAVVVIDSKSMCWGGDDENSNDENATFVKELHAHFVERYGAAVIVTHHLTKNKEKEEQTARGASALINNIDHEWRFEMRATSATSVMEPGSKLRIARWEKMHFGIKVVTALEQDFPWLKNSQGDLPSVSVAMLTNAHGVSAKRQQEDAEFAALLKVLLPGLDVKQKRQVNDSVARGLGKVVEGTPDKTAASARDWVRLRLRKLQEQKLIDEEYALTPAGRLFLEHFEQAQALTSEPEEKSSDNT